MGETDFCLHRKHQQSELLLLPTAKGRTRVAVVISFSVGGTGLKVEKPRNVEFVRVSACRQIGSDGRQQVLVL